MNYMWSHGIKKKKKTCTAASGGRESIAVPHMACAPCDPRRPAVDVRSQYAAERHYTTCPFGTRQAILNAGIPSDARRVGTGGHASARTGLPLNITTMTRKPRTPDGHTSSHRPNLVPGVPSTPRTQTINNWFHPAVFCIIPAERHVATWVGTSPMARECTDRQSLQNVSITDPRLIPGGLPTTSSTIRFSRTPSTASGPDGHHPAVSGSFGRITSIIHRTVDVSPARL